MPKFGDCSGSVSGHDGGGADGKCTWCGRRVNAPVGPPPAQRGQHSDLYDSYRYHHDPDWGDDPYDF